jgi:hypothetical protein
MIEERIGEVRVRVRTNVPDAEAIRPIAERIVRAALERCAALLEERAPGRVVLIRRLPLRWRIDESVLEDAQQIGELARAAADAIERISVPSSLEPPAAREGAVVFEDEAHWRASYLLALARGQPAWFYEALGGSGAGEALAVLAAPERRLMAEAVLVRLARAGVLAEALKAQPAAAVKALADALGCNGRPGPMPQGGPESGEAAVAPANMGETAASAELATVAARWPVLAPEARRLALRVHAAVLLACGVESPRAAALVASVPQHGAAVSPVEPRTPPREAVRDGAATEHRVSVEPPQEAPAAEAEQFATTASTACGGLFHLLDRVQELDLAESLWKACLPEGTVLAAAAAALLGTRFATDPAPGLFGGVESISVPDASPEQQAEVAMASCTALAEALPRRGIAEIPSVLVSLVEHSAGRLLVAAAEQSPFAFFAWPAATREALSEGLRTLLAAWPHHASLAAAPALASLDATGRLRPRRDIVPAPLLIPKAPSAASGALLALVAGAPCTLFSARARSSSLDTAEAFVTRFLARQGRVRTGPEQMQIILSAGDIDPTVRRAGLDRDPGWLPWLRRTVRFVFEESEPIEETEPAALPFGDES